MFDRDGDGQLDRREMLDVLRAVDVAVPEAAAAGRWSSWLPGSSSKPNRSAASAAAATPPAAGAPAAADDEPDEQERLDELLSAMQAAGNRDGKISFDEMKRALQTHAFYRLRTGRYVVAVSLPEAEGLRAALHAARGAAGSLPAAPSAELALRYNGAILDATSGFVDGSIGAGEDYLSAIAQQCLRFVDAQLQYTKGESNMLLRALQSNSMAHRKDFFLASRHCRRRRPADWKAHSIARLFTTEDEYQLLHLLNQL